MVKREKKVMTEDVKAVASRVKSLRVDRNINQTDFASRCGLSVQRLYHYEAANRPIPLDVLRSMAETLSVSQGELLGEPAVAGKKK